MLLKRRKMDLPDLADIENAQAMTAQLKAMTDYNIMMGNIEDPMEDQEDEEDE